MTYHVCISYITRSSDGQAELIWVIHRSGLPTRRSLPTLELIPAECNYINALLISQTAKLCYIFKQKYDIC